jgi:hypothetical protein
MDLRDQKESYRQDDKTRRSIKFSTWISEIRKKAIARTTRPDEASTSSSLVLLIVVVAVLLLLGLPR